MKTAFALAASLVLGLALVGCDGDDGATSSSSSSGSGAASKVVGGVTIPATIKLCSQNMTAVASSPTTNGGFSWRAVPSATRYAVLANKAPKDATVLTELFNGVVDGTASGGSYTFPERVSGTSYSIEVYALAGSEPLCQLDGINGFTAP